MKKISLTRKELENFAIDALEIGKADLRRMSTLLLAQLLELKLEGDSRAFYLANEIKCLEKACRGIGTKTRTDKMLEEWIVFKRYHGANYYLTLACPDEGDQNINQRVRDAYEFDFPFLQESYERVWAVG